MLFFLVSRNKCILCRNVSVWDTWWVNYILSPIPGFFLLCLTVDLDGNNFFCVILGSMWAEPTYGHISVALHWKGPGCPGLFFYLCLCHHIVLLGLLAHRKPSVFPSVVVTPWLSVLWEHKLLNQRGKNLWILLFSLYRCNFGLKLSFSFVFFLENLTSLCQSGLNYLEENFFFTNRWATLIHWLLSPWLIEINHRFCLCALGLSLLSNFLGLHIPLKFKSFGVLI